MYTLERDPQENLKGMSREPLQYMGEPSAVSRRKPSTEEELGPGKTETEAPESTRNSRPDRISRTNRREGQLILSKGATVAPAGWIGESTCRTTRFPKRNRVPYSLMHHPHVSCDTSRFRRLKIWKKELGSEKGKENGSEVESVWEAGFWRSGSGEEP